jgi:hypothetical protein
VLLMAFRLATNERAPDLHALVVSVLVIDPASHLPSIDSRRRVPEAVDGWSTLLLSMPLAVGRQTRTPLLHAPAIERTGADMVPFTSARAAVGAPPRGSMAVRNRARI